MKIIDIQKKILFTCSFFFFLFSYNTHALEPLFTKSAKVYSEITIDSVLTYYKGRKLEEIKDFDAYELEFDITVPVFKNAQVRLSWPAYTSGSGTVSDPTSPHDGSSTDVKGNGGTYNFLSLGLEYQFIHSQQSGYNLLAYGSYGARTSYLDTTHDDNLNHTGNVTKFGLRYDKGMSQYSSHIFTSIEYRHYWDSDDINPGDDNSPNFNMVNISAAWMWNRNSPLSPLLELSYSTDIAQYHAINIIPEVIYTINSAIDLKLGVPIGLSSDADDYAIRFGITTRF